MPLDPEDRRRRGHPGQENTGDRTGGELAVAAVTAVEAVDAAFFLAVPDSGALLESLRTLARGSG